MDSNETLPDVVLTLIDSSVDPLALINLLLDHGLKIFGLLLSNVSKGMVKIWS